MNENGKNIQIRNSTIDFLVFTKQNSEDGIEVRVHDENVWLSQKGMAEVFDCSTDNISLHLKNIFNEGEIKPELVTEVSSATAADGKRYKTKFYNLDAIISVGYRVNSLRATQFRQWATKVLRTYAVQEYVLDKKRLKMDRFLTKSILSIYWIKFERFEPVNESFIKKLLIFMQWQLIIQKMP